MSFLASSALHPARRSRPFLRLLCALSCLAGTALICSPAQADDEARAASLAREAEKLISAGNFAEACPKLDESQRLDARGATALDLAICREKEGKLGDAYRAYGVALKLAKKEKRFDRSRTAKMARNKLYLRIPRLTIKVDKKNAPDGLTITVNGQPVPESEWNKAYIVNPGSLTLAASAPGKTSWKTTIDIGVAKRKKTTVPALEDAPETPAPNGGNKPAEQPPSAPVKPAEPIDNGDDDDSGSSSDHATLRPVIELGALGGMMISAVGRGGRGELSGTSYLIQSNSGGQFFATCSDTIAFPGTGECDAELETMIGGLVGGTLFGGISLDPRVHVGGRVFGGVRFPNGFWFAGGPSGSFRTVGPLWLGASLLFGAEEHRANIVDARGSVPADLQGINGGEFVDVPVGPGSDVPEITAAEVATGFLIGGSLEISMALLGPSPHAIVPTGRTEFLDGSLMISLHPAIMVGSEGMIISIPGSVGYRFH